MGQEAGARGGDAVVVDELEKYGLQWHLKGACQLREGSKNRKIYEEIYDQRHCVSVDRGRQLADLILSQKRSFLEIARLSVACLYIERSINQGKSLRCMVSRKDCVITVENGH